MAQSLEQQLKKVLSKYADDVQNNLENLSKEFAMKGAAELRKTSKQFHHKGTTGYASGWTSTFETGRLSAQGIIYNKKVPGLPHLLENGHALRQGGRSPGRAHIAPVEEKIVEEFERACANDL